MSHQSLRGQTCLTQPLQGYTNDKRKAKGKTGYANGKGNKGNKMSYSWSEEGRCVDNPPSGIRSSND